VSESTRGVLKRRSPCVTTSDIVRPAVGPARSPVKSVSVVPTI